MIRRIIIVMVVLALVSGAVAGAYWWQLGQLPDELAADSSDLSPWSAPVDPDADDARLETLSTQLQQVWGSLDDGHGKHFFVDSQVGHDKVPISKEMRTTHWQILETLRPAALAYPLDRRAHRDANTPSPQQVADVFKRIADRAVLAGEWQIALQYVEAALLLRATIAPQLRLLEIGSHAHQVERLVRRLKDIALGHANSLSRCIEITHSIPRFVGDPYQALWNEYSAFLATPPPAGLYVRRARHRDGEIFSLWLRALSRWNPTQQSNSAQVERLAQFLPDSNSLERYLKTWTEYHQQLAVIDVLVHTIRGL